MNKNEKTNTIVQSFIAKIISEEWVELSENELRNLCQYADYNKIPDRIISNNEELHDMIPWERVDRMKIIRVVARNIKIINFVDLSKYNYTIKEARSFLKIHPHLIDKIGIDFEKIKKAEAFSLLTVGLEEISEKIDVKKYDFNASETYDIIKANNFKEHIIGRISLINLEDYHICGIIINTGDKHFDILNLNKLTTKKWVEILQNRPELLYYCDLKMFLKSDIYNSVELICIFPNEDFDYLIKDRNYKEELSPLGWEKLLMSKPDIYSDICCFEKLNETAWKNILEFCPSLINYKN